MKGLFCVVLLVGGCGGDVASSTDGERSTGGTRAIDGSFSGGAPTSGGVGGAADGNEVSIAGKPPIDGGCASSCVIQLGYSCCSGACVWTSNDPQNCGACGKACPLTLHFA